MPTSSIFRNITLTTEEEVENFVNALEEAEKNTRYISSNLIREKSDKEIKEVVVNINQKKQKLLLPISEKWRIKKMKNTVPLELQVSLEIKENAEIILDELGLTLSDAVNMYLAQIIQVGGIPFDVKLSNK